MIRLMNRHVACIVRAFPLPVAYPRPTGARLKRIFLLSYGIFIPCLSWYRCVFPSCSQIRAAICVCANIVKKPLSSAGREMNFAARNVRINLMFTNQEKRKRRTNRITAKKCLRHSGYCGILSIMKNICANRCPTGATDIRIARLFIHKIAVTFGRVAAIFVSCYYLCYRWRIRDRNRSGISRVLKSILLSSTFTSALLSPDSLAGFYVSKIHCNRRVTVPP